MLPTLGLLGLLLPACSEAAADSVQNEPLPAMTIAWISKGKCNSFFDISRVGVTLASQDIASLTQRPVEVVLMEPDDCQTTPNPPSTDSCAASAPQMEQVEAAIARQVQAIAITVSDPECLTPLIDRAVDAGIRVMTFDSDAPHSKRHTYFGMNNRKAAHLAARSLAKLIGDSGKIAIQTAMTKDVEGGYHLSSSSSYVDRMAGIQEELKNHPNITVVDTVPCVDNAVTDDVCAKEVEKVLAATPDLAGFMFSRGKVLREQSLAEKAPTFTAAVQSGSFHSVAFDAPEDAIENIRAGYADQVIAQKQFSWGYEVVTLTFDALVNDFQLPGFYDFGWYTLCSENIDEYAKRWAARDFRDEFPNCDYLEEQP